MGNTYSRPNLYRHDTLCVLSQAAEPQEGVCGTAPQGIAWSPDQPVQHLCSKPRRRSTSDGYQSKTLRKRLDVYCRCDLVNDVCRRSSLGDGLTFTVELEGFIDTINRAEDDLIPHNTQLTVVLSMNARFQINLLGKCKADKVIGDL